MAMMAKYPVPHVDPIRIIWGGLSDPEWPFISFRGDGEMGPVDFFAHGDTTTFCACRRGRKGQIVDDSF